MRRSGLILLTVLLGLTSCRLAGSGASAEPVSIAATSSGGQAVDPIDTLSPMTAPSLAYVWPPAFLTITPVHNGVADDTPAECIELDTEFLQQWCTTLLLPRELAGTPEPDQMGQTVETFAYLIRRVVEDPATACTDTLILHWYAIAPFGNGGKTPREACDAFIEKALAEGLTRVSDPGTGTTVLVPVR